MIRDEISISIPCSILMFPITGGIELGSISHLLSSKKKSLCGLGEVGKLGVDIGRV